MGLFTQKTRNPRKFDYEPRFYNPDKEEKLRHRMRVKRRASKRRNPMAIVYFAVLLLIVLFMMYGL